MVKRLIELIEQAVDLALSKHISLTSEMIAAHLVENGVKIIVCCKDCEWRDVEDDCVNPKCGKSWFLR